MATTRICSVPDCGKKVTCRGLCNAHYLRKQRYGDPEARAAGRINTKVDWLRAHASFASDACLYWPFTKMSTGYGVLTISGRRALAHREMCHLAHGEPQGHQHQVAHACGRGKDGCVNPRHLRWATQSENEADKIHHGRSNRGERCSNAKLTVDNVRYIRKMRGHMTQAALGDRFNITATNVSHIWNRKSWAWL